MQQIDPIVANSAAGSTPNVDTGMTSDPKAQCWMNGSSLIRRTPKVDANQLTSLSALIAYMAAQSGKSEFRIERNLADHFNVPNAKFLPSSQFNDAVRFLIDNN